MISHVLWCDDSRNYRHDVLCSVHVVCELAAEAGPCNNATDRWYHNATSGRCELFAYGGCHGNGNNFESESQCTSACVLTDVNGQCCLRLRSYEKC